MERHFFASANSYQGFFSYFTHILPARDRVSGIYLKGGSGTGKSSLLKKAAAVFSKNDWVVEFFHCTNDAGSLDGICVPDKKIMIVDATAPHVQDPVLPVLADSIVDLAVCLDKSKLTPYRDELLSLQKAKKALFDTSYRYIQAAHAVYTVNDQIYRSAWDHVKLNKMLLTHMQPLLEKGMVEKEGQARKLFLSAITPEGVVHFVDNGIPCKTVYALKAPGTVMSSYFLHKIAETANFAGLDTENFYHPVDPSILEHVTIPSLDLAYTTGSNGENELDLGTACYWDTLYRQDENIRANKHLYQTLLQFAINTTHNAKTLHSRIEEIYKQGMDFKKLDEMTEELLTQLG